MAPAYIRHVSFRILNIVIFVSYIIAVPLPIPETFYAESINSLLANKCKMPEKIVLPFRNASDLNFSYLSDPLEECKTTAAKDANEEAHMLCEEVFEVLHNITCSFGNASLPVINSTLNFDNVCSEFIVMKDYLPKRNEYLSNRLVDAVVCKLLCSEKFKTLCQTLLWGYDVQVLIKNAIEKAKETPAVTVSSKDGIPNADAVEKPKETPDVAVVSSKEGIPKAGAKEENQLPNSQENDMSNNDATGSQVNMENIQQEPVLDNKLDGNPNGEEPNYENEIPSLNSKMTKNKVESNNRDVNLLNSQSSTISVNPSSPNSGLTNNGPSDFKNVFQSRIVLVGNATVDTQVPSLEININTSENLGNNLEVAVKNVKKEDNKINEKDLDQKVDSELNNMASKPVAEKALNVSEQKKDAKPGNVKNEGNNKDVSPIDKDQTKVSSPNSANNPDENELNNVNLQEEEVPKETGKQNESPVSGTSDKNSEKSKENVFVVPDKVTSDSSSKIEPTTLLVNPDTKVEEDQEEKDAEQYYKNAMNDLKIKKQTVKSSVVSEIANPNDDVANNFDLLLTRNSYGRGRVDGTSMISSFPEQEDSHFFFYFLTIVLILMAGYMLFHNKQKIIALIVEGRHERRRRSHGAAYKKLDTK